MLNIFYPFKIHYIQHSFMIIYNVLILAKNLGYALFYLAFLFRKTYDLVVFKST